ncbi:MAG: (2S)-methylsuccinyl-CoA dehydrogenase, partial [Bradymonadia bacterium]
MGLAALCESEGRLSRELLDQHQPGAFDLARALAEQAAAEAIDAWACAHGPTESALADIYVAGVVKASATRLRFSSESFGLIPASAAPLDEFAAWVESTTTAATIETLSSAMVEGGTGSAGAYGLSEDHADMRALFARFADERVAPEAEHIHRNDLVIPEPLLKDLAELGVFGISIPEEYGGSFLDHLTMCLATEELSRASLGAGGSVITRPEICAKAILKGGTDEQKKKWL